jgi:hypothetical protein
MPLKISEDQRQQALRLRAEGATRKQVSEATGLSISTLKRLEDPAVAEKHRDWSRIQRLGQSKLVDFGAQRNEQRIYYIRCLAEVMQVPFGYLADELDLIAMRWADESQDHQPYF